MNAEKRIKQLFVICIILAVSSVIIPRFTANPDGGFAAATTAALSLLGGLVISLLASVYLLVFTLNNFSEVSRISKFLGISPSIVLAMALIALIIFVSLG